MTPPYLPALTGSELLDYASNNAVTDLEKALVSVLGPAYDLSVKADELANSVRMTALYDARTPDTITEDLLKALAAYED